MTETPTPRGRINIAFTVAATQAADRVIERFAVMHTGGSHNLDRVDLARIGVAYALRAGHSLHRPDNFGSASGTNLNVGSVDPGGELRDLLRALHPELDDDPYRVMETLMTTGVLAIDKEVSSGAIYSLKTLIAHEPARP